MQESRAGSEEKRFSSSMADLAPVLHETAEQGEYYLPPEQLQLLEKLEHLSRYSHFIQIILGVPGSGKSTLLKQFLPAGQDPDVQLCHLQIEHDTRLGDLLDELNQQLEIDLAVAASDEDKLQALYQHADLLEDISRHFMIVVDDADRLDDECLDLLVNLLPSVRNPDARPHLILFAAPKLTERMGASPVFREILEENCHFSELKSLDTEEIREFLCHRYGAVAEDLSSRQLARIQQDSFGLPGRIPKAMEKLLAGAAADGKSEKASRPGRLLPWLGTGLAGVMLIAVASWLFMPDQITSNGEERIRVELSLPTPSPEQPDAGRLAGAEDAEPKNAASELEQRLKAAEIRLEAESRASLEAAGNMQNNKDTVAEQPTPAVQETEASDAADAPTGVNITRNSRIAVAPVKPAPPELTEEKKPAAKPVAEAADEPKKLVLKLPTPEAKPAVPARTLKLSAGKKPAGAYSSLEEELLSWNPSGYTLQMLGARKASSVTRFIRSQSSPENFHHFSTIYKERPWYVVVYGNYPSRQKAVAAVKTLPSGLRKRKPWARSIQGVQDDIRRKK